MCITIAIHLSLQWWIEKKTVKQTCFSFSELNYTISQFQFLRWEEEDGRLTYSFLGLF